MHDPCYHTQILQPVKRVYIHTTAELFDDDPEIFVRIKWVDPSETSFSFVFYAELIHVNETGRYYYDYAHLRTAHGTCGDRPLSMILLGEHDYFSTTAEDVIGRWYNRRIPFGGIVPNQVDVGNLKGGVAAEKAKRRII